MDLSAKLNTALANGFNLRWNIFGTETGTTALLCCITGPLLNPFSQHILNPRNTVIPFAQHKMKNYSFSHIYLAIYSLYRQPDIDKIQINRCGQMKQGDNPS
jgi:hypothetical protein